MQQTTDCGVVSGIRAEPTLVSRRMLIGGMAGGMAMALSPAAARAATGTREWRLAFRNVHNGESFDAVFARDGQFVADGLAELNHGLRDWRTGEVMAIDRKLLALLMRLRDALGVAPGRSIDLISGYRSPHTNGALKAPGGGHSGVATRSQHMLGKATDIRLPGIPLDQQRRAALILAGGGVGYYPADGFVHIDTGRVRHW